jgi:hypothetical protein
VGDTKSTQSGGLDEGENSGDNWREGGNGGDDVTREGGNNGDDMGKVRIVGMTWREESGDILLFTTSTIT